MPRVHSNAEIAARSLGFRFPGFMRFSSVGEGHSSCEMFEAEHKRSKVCIARFGYKLFVDVPSDSEGSFSAEAAYDLIENEIRTSNSPENEVVAVFTPSQNFTRMLGGLYKKQEAALEWRENYLLAKGALPPRPAVPRGYCLVELTPVLLKSGFANTQELMEEMSSERASVEDFLNKGFGICAIIDRQLAGWCLSEYNCSKGCEIGIGVVKDHRHKGLAQAMVSEFVQMSREKGYESIGWDCHRQNAASWHTAQKSGFSIRGSYPTILICKNKAMQYGANGNIALRDGDGDTALYWYKKAAQHKDVPFWVFINMAQIQALTGDINLVIEAYKGLERAKYEN